MATPKPAEQTGPRQAREAAYVTFTGDSGAILAIVPALGDTQTFTVKAKAKTDKNDDRKDGEIRRTVTFQLVDVLPGEIVSAPHDDQLSLVEDDE